MNQNDSSQNPSRDRLIKNFEEAATQIAPAPAPAHAPVPFASCFGRYQLLEELGRGGMGVVYKAYDPILKRNIALKIVGDQATANENTRKRFEREASLMAKLNHPNIVKVFDLGEEQGKYFFTMEIVEGMGLNKAMQKNNPLPKMIRILIQATQAIQYAHEQGVIHRDIKPSNIMITSEGDVKVMDFGLAKEIVERGKKLSRTQEVLGTPEYMAPEQAEGKRIDKQGDVYSLGVILYEMITGHPPFTGTAMEILYKIASQEPRPPSHFFPYLAKDLETVCLKALEKNKERRYKTAQEFADDLTRYLQGEPIRARKVGKIYKAWKWALRNKIVSSAITALVLFAFLFIYIAYIFVFSPGYLSITCANDNSLIPEIKVDYKTISQVSKIVWESKKKEPSASKFGFRFPLYPGTHKIVLEHPDYESQSFTVNIRSGDEIAMEKPMIVKKGKLTILSSLSEIEAVCTNKKTNEVIRFNAPVYDYPIPPGEYEVVFQKQNYFPEKKEISIKKEDKLSLDIRLHPMLLWSYEYKDMQEINHITLADMDKDGKLEILCFWQSGRITAHSLENNQKLWEINRNVPWQKDSYQTAIHDLNKDGYPDILCAQHHNMFAICGKTKKEIFSLPYFWGYNFILTDANGDGYEDCIIHRNYHPMDCYDFKTKKSLWQIQDLRNAVPAKDLLPDKIHLPVGLAGKLYYVNVANGTYALAVSYGKNIPRDMQVSCIRQKPNEAGIQKTFIVLDNYEDGLVCIDGITRNIVWQWKHNPCQIEGFLLEDLDQDGKQEIFINLDKLYCLDIETGKERWHLDIKGGGFLPYAADMEGDGKPEIIAYSQDQKIYFVDGVKGYKINEFFCPQTVKTIITCDVNRDGDLEILFLAGQKLYCIQHRVNMDFPTRVWKESEQNFFFCADKDINGDGYKDIVLVTASGDVQCLSGRNGNPIWQYDMQYQMKEGACLPAVADINSDGLLEIVTFASKEIHALDTSGKKVWSRSEEIYDDHRKFVVVADTNGDRNPEILFVCGHRGYIYCLDGRTGDRIWQAFIERTFDIPVVADVDNDGCMEVLVSPGVTNNQGAIFYCLRGKDGEPKWKRYIPTLSEGAEIVVGNMNSEKMPIILVSQVGGHCSCLDGKTGNVYWHAQLLSGDIKASRIGDYDGDGKFEAVMCSANNSVHCLDLATGKVKWMQRFDSRPVTFMDIDMIRVNPKILDLKQDVDGDGLNDLLVTNSLHSFCLLSGKTGAKKGFCQDFGILNVQWEMTDMDADGKQDLLFIDADNRLVSIYNITQYLNKFFVTPRFYGSRYQNASILRLAWWNEMIGSRNTASLAKDIQLHSKEMAGWQHVLPFYEAMCNFPNMIQDYRVSLPETRFLQAIAWLNQNNSDNAYALLEPILKESTLNFDRLYQTLGDFLSPAGKENYYRLLPRLVEKTSCWQNVDMAYASAVWEGRNEDYFLELSLKYGLRSDAGFETKRKTYLSKINNAIPNANSVYSWHNIIRIINHAMDVLWEDPELYLLRGRTYFQYASQNMKLCIRDIDKAIALMPESIEAYWWRCRARYEMRMYKESLEDFEMTIRYDRTKTNEVSLAYSILLIAGGKQTQAQKLLEIQRQSFGKMEPQSSYIKILECLCEGNKKMAYQVMIGKQKLLSDGVLNNFIYRWIME